MILRNRMLLTTGLAAIVAAAPAYAQQDERKAPPTPQEGAADDSIVVTGIRKSLQDSLNTKRKAGSIVDVISAEGVGKFPDTNVAESLSHLPGVTVDHTFGEGEQVSIAGVEPALNRILIDGHDIASANWGGNTNDRSSRSFNYSLLSPEIISQAIVYKTPEARIQEGAIGGTVDIITRKPLDLKPNTITASGGYNYNDRSEKGSPRGSALYSWHNADGTFGVLGSVSFDREYLDRAGVEIFGYGTGKDYVQKDAGGNVVLDSSGQPIPLNPNLVVNGGTKADLVNARYAAYLNHAFFEQTRQRLGFSGALQYKPADNLTLTASGLAIRGKYNNLNQSEFTYNTNGNTLQQATISNGLITSETFGPSTTTSGELDTNYRVTKVKNTTGSLAFDWNVKDWNVTGNGGYTKATGGKHPEYILNFHTTQGFTVGADGRNTMLNWQYAPSVTNQWVGASAANFSSQNEPAVLAANGGNAFDGQQIGGITNADQTVDVEKFAQLDFERDVDFGPITKILFGGRYNDHDNKQTTYGGATFSDAAFTLADLTTDALKNNLFDGLGTTGNAVPFVGLNTSNVISTLNRDGTLSVTRSLDTGSYFRVNEQIATGYVQANFELGKFRGNIGGRFVHTRDDAHYYLTSTSLAADGSSVTATIPVSTVHDDNRFLPAFNLAYDAGNSVVLRAAAAKVIARPRFSDLAGAISLDDDTLSGSGGNPNLHPYAATNFGASAEWYFSPGGLLSGEIFYRDITNYISNINSRETITNQSTGRTLTYDVSTPINAGRASVTGFSITAQTNIKWGFGIQANYTFADANTGLNGQGLPFLSRNTVNLVPYFEKGPFQARLSYNRRSKYFYQFGRLASADYTAAYQQLDFSMSYKLTRNFTVTATGSNLLDETYYQYSSTPSAPSALYKNGRVFSLSASFKM